MHFLQGQTDDLLSESPVFEKAIPKERRPKKQRDTGGMPIASPSSQSSSQSQEVEPELDQQLLVEIDDYLKQRMEHPEREIDMSDCPFGSEGAKCVAAAVSFCDGLEDIKLRNCEIRDAGAKALFEEFAGC